MKIGIISREYPPLTHIGGIATFSAAAAKLLAEHGHEVHVVCNGNQRRIEENNGITVHRVEMLPHHFPTGRFFYLYRKWYRRNLPHYLDALTWARTSAAYISYQFKNENMDLWEYPETGGEGALFPIFPNSPDLTKALQPRLIARIHTGWLEAYATNRIESALLLRLQKKACQRACHLVSPSAYMAGDYIRKTLNLSSPVTVSRNPITLWGTPIAWQTKSMNHILYVGRIEHRKGLQVLLAALKILGLDAAGLTIRVVGHQHPPTRPLDAQCLKTFKACLASQDMAQYKLEYAGPCEHSTMQIHYDWAGIQILPSLMENYPYVALEGLSRGCYLIGSSVGGIPEIINEQKRGLLFEAENSTQLAEKIRECRRKKLEISKGMPGIAESIRTEFDSETCYLRLMDIYDTDFSIRAREKGLPKS